MVAKHTLDKNRLGLWSILIAILCMAGTAAAQAPEKSFANLVMVEGNIGGTRSFGAGIVIGTRAGRIYIATANHVVRSGRTETAKEIKVKFRFLPGEKFPATLLESRDKQLDLAVLSVKASADAVPSSQFNFNVLGNSSKLNRGSSVHPLGNPSNKNWGVSINPERVDSVKATEIVFQSSYIQKGHSGGALLDGCGDIVGMIVRDSPPTGEAVRIESVLDVLRTWNYPINLKSGGGCAPSTQFQQPASPQPATLGRGFAVDDNYEAPVTLGTGASQKFVISKPEGVGIFLFTPQESGEYNITALSEPDQVDIGWYLFDDPTLNLPLVQCDNDYPRRGTEPCAVQLEAGQTYILVAENLTGDETGEPSEPVFFTFTIQFEY